MLGPRQEDDGLGGHAVITDGNDSPSGILTSGKGC